MNKFKGHFPLKTDASALQRPILTTILQRRDSCLQLKGHITQGGGHGHLGRPSRWEPHSIPRRLPSLSGWPFPDLLLGLHCCQLPQVFQPLMHFLHLYRIYLRLRDLFSTFTLRREDNPLRSSDLICSSAAACECLAEGLVPSGSARACCTFHTDVKPEGDMGRCVGR